MPTIADSIKVHLPDGSVKEFPAGSTPHDVAQSISPRLAAAAVVARIRPLAAEEPATNALNETGEPEASMYGAEEANAERLVDLSMPLNQEVSLQLLTEKDADALKVVRHSAAHVMATAVLELYPETKLGHGPATDAGFFYDFYRPTPFTPEDLKAIEGKMAEVVARNEPFVREWESRDQSLARGDLVLPQRRFRRFLPRSACALYRQGQGVQSDEPGWGLLAGRRKESPVAAHLWHGIFFQQGDGAALRPLGRGTAAGPSCAG
jgi:threonyl-tRNA synthetase